MGRHRLDFFRGVGQGVGPCRVDYGSSFVFAFLPVVSASKCSQEVEELGSQPSPPSFGLQLGETVGHSWTSRLVDFRPRNLASEPGGMAPKKTQNNTSEASMLLKTHRAFGKRTQNELKKEPSLGCLRREPMPNSEVARLDGKKPRTRLATLATLPDFWGFDGPIRIGPEIGLPREEGC